VADQIGPRCGNNPNVQLTPGDRKALDDFRDFLDQRAAEAGRSQPTVSEADAERLAALADCTDGSRGGLHCDHYQEGDGACCSCGRPNWCPDGGVVSSAGQAEEELCRAPAVAGLVPAADRAALAEDLRYALTHREPGHDHEQPGVWDGSGMQCGHCARLAVARGNLAAYDAGPDAVLPAPADRAADVAQHVTRAIFALKSPAPAGSEHYRSGWDDGLEAAMDATRHAVLRRMADETPQPAEDPTPDQPVVRATRYLVTCVPEHRDPGGYRGVTVEYRGDERWAILHYALCLGTDGRWARERQSSERDEEWLATHRFDLATARRLAEEQAKDLVRPAKDHRPTAPAQPDPEAVQLDEDGRDAETGCLPGCASQSYPDPGICSCGDDGPPAASAQPGKEA